MKKIPAHLFVILIASCSHKTDARSPSSSPQPNLHRHFLERSGFVPTAAELEKAESTDFETLVKRTVEEASLSKETARPSFTTERAPPKGKKNRKQKRERRKAVRADIASAQNQWATNLLETQNPLYERMVLFWANHFVTSAQKVKNPHLIWGQHEIFRADAVGSFATMLREIIRDPAMLMYLDNQRNYKDAPNENLARELMELFTLGEGNYTEQDVKEAARALTGYSIDRDKRFRFRKGQHDKSEKTILGKTSTFDGDELIEHLLAQEKCANFIISKLWQEFISDEAPPAKVNEIARAFHKSGYDISVALNSLFLTKEFEAQAGKGSLVKSPIELLIGTERVLQTGASKQELIKGATKMGQSLFYPPNVKGWVKHTSWITTATLALRQRALRKIWKSRLGSAPLKVAPEALLATPSVGTIKSSDDLDRRLFQVFLDPAYQAK